MSYTHDYQRNQQTTLLENQDSLLIGTSSPKSGINSFNPSRKVSSFQQNRNRKPNETGYINDHERGLLSSIDQELKNFAEAPDYRISHRLLYGIQNKNNEVKIENENQKLWGPYVVLIDSQKRLLENAFKDADTFDDGTVQKYIYLHVLRNNKDIIKILHVNTIQISENKYLNLEEALDIIENDGDLYEEITFEQFMEYFDLIYKTNSQLAGWISERTETLLDNKYLKIIKNIFDALPKWDKDKVSREEFIFSLFDDPQVQEFLKLKAREDKVTKQIESVEDVLKRIDKESAEYLKWNDIIDFFCAIGAPKRTLKEKLDMMDFERKNSYTSFIDEYNRENNQKKENENIEKNTQKLGKSNPIQNKNLLPRPYSSGRIPKKNKKVSKSTNAIKTEIFTPNSKVLLITQKSFTDKDQLKSSIITIEKSKIEMPKLETNKFKAKPPPQTNNIPLYNQMTHQLEDDKKIRIDSAAKKSLEEAKSPIKRFEKGENKHLKPIYQSKQRINSVKNQSDIDKFWEEFNLDEKNLKFDKSSDKRKLIHDLEGSKNLIFNGLESMLHNKEYTDTESLSTIRHILGEEGKEQLEKSKMASYLQDAQLKTKYETDKERLTKRINHPPLVSDLLSSIYETSYPTNFITTIKQKMINRGIQREKILGEVTGLEYVYAEDLV